MTAEPLPFLTRLWFALVCWFRLLVDGAFARQVWQLARPDEAGGPPLPEAERPAPALPARPEPKAPELVVPPPGPSPSEGALQLLALLQREGRFIDFLEEDLNGFPDDRVGSVARVVHEGCRRALHEHVALEAVRAEDEGARVRLESGFDAGRVKLVGNVQGSGPFEGVLRHRGWLARDVRLPTLVRGADAHLLAPAEVEL
ncbi:MAG TPA: DUF2760 domain-containing protein [Polyangiaceae bacterium]|nr:DUF2760 domain-containing protein [Polyangiaceae bacterium]